MRGMHSFSLHDRTVNNLLQKIAQEIKNDGWRPTKGIFKNLIPDLVFGDPKDQNMIVIEVGSTTAEKIYKYFGDKSIKEIRWYTKKSNLVGQWVRDNGQWNQKPFNERLLSKMDRVEWPGIYKRGNNWGIDYRYKGKRCREMIGPDKDLAIDVLCKRRVEIRENKFNKDGNN